MCPSTTEPGIRHFRDKCGELLAIQTTGALPSLLSKVESAFVERALMIASKEWRGKNSRYEAHLCDPPAMDDETYFNPSYMGCVHDDDEEILGPELSKDRPKSFY